jgi:Tat protein translocase TatB subunit
MFNMGLGEILVVVAVALVFVGPAKLPEIARTVGRGLGRLRRASDEVRDTIQSEINSLEREEIKKKIEADKTAAVGPYSGADPDIQEAAPQPVAASNAISQAGAAPEAAPQPAPIQDEPEAPATDTDTDTDTDKDTDKKIQ